MAGRWKARGDNLKLGAARGDSFAGGVRCRQNLCGSVAAALPLRLSNARLSNGKMAFETACGTYQRLRLARRRHGQAAKRQNRRHGGKTQAWARSYIANWAAFRMRRK
jgi:hypothetical protein